MVTERLNNVSRKHKAEFNNRIPAEADIRAFLARMQDTVESNDPAVWEASLGDWMRLHKIDTPEVQKTMHNGQFWSGVTLGKHYFYPVFVGLGAGALLLSPHTDDYEVAYGRAKKELVIALAAAFLEPLANSIAFIAHVPPSDRNMRTTADISETLSTPMLKDANKTMSSAIELAKRATVPGAEATDRDLDDAIKIVKKAINHLMQGRHEWQMRSKMNDVYYEGYGLQSIPKGFQGYGNAGSIVVGMKYGLQAAGIMQFALAGGVMASFLPLSGIDKVKLESSMQPLNMLDVYKKVDLGPAEGEEGHDPEKVMKGRIVVAKRQRTELDVRQVQARQRLWIDMRKYAMLSANLLNSWADVLNPSNTPITPDEWIRYTTLNERIGHLPALNEAEINDHATLQTRVDAAKAQLNPEQSDALAKLERVWAQTELDPTALEAGTGETSKAAAKLLGMSEADWSRWANLQDRIDFPGLKTRIEHKMAGLSDDNQEKLREWTNAWLETSPDLNRIMKMNYGQVSDRNKLKVDRILDIAQYDSGVGSSMWRMAKNYTPWTEEFSTGLREIGFGRVGLPEEIIAPIALSYWFFFHFVVGGPIFPLALGAAMGVNDSRMRLKASKIESAVERQNEFDRIDKIAHAERYALLGFIASVAVLGSIASMSLSNTKVGKKTSWVEKCNTLLGMGSTHQIGSLTAFFLFCRGSSRASQALGKFQQINSRGVFTGEYLKETAKIVWKGLFLLGQEGWAAHKGRGLISEVNALLPQLRGMLREMEAQLEARARPADGEALNEEEVSQAQAQIEELRDVIHLTEATIETMELADEIENNADLQGEEPGNQAIEEVMARPLPGASDVRETVGSLVDQYYATSVILEEASREAREEIARELEAQEGKNAADAGKASAS